MNLLQLKATVASYHHKEVDELVNGPVDLFLVAANNARRNAEKLHDFENSRCTAVLAIDGVLGGKLTDAVISPPDVFSGIKSIVGISGLNLGGNFIPFDLARIDIDLERTRYELELSNGFWPENRYPSDAQILNRVGTGSLVFRAGSIYNFPRTNIASDAPLVTYIEAYGWYKDYLAADLVHETALPQDFFIDVGFEYMQWACIVELNYLFQTYVPRQEGNVGSPEKKLADALQRLVVWDSYSIDPNTTRSR